VKVPMALYLLVVGASNQVSVKFFSRFLRHF
jgi:hypothetical protein